MKKRINHIEQLEELDQQQFAAWLRRGFEDLFHEDREVTAFAPMHHYIGRQSDIIDDLKNIYDALSGTAKENFRLGVKLSFSSLPPENQYIPLIRSFLHLAGKIHAVEILPEVVKQIGNGYFGIPYNNEGNELFALSLDIVSGMAPYSDVGDIVRRLAGSSFFKSDYAPLAFFALFRTEPDKFPDHLKLLRPDFTKLHKNRGTRTSFITALRFVQYVDLETISKNLWWLYLTMNPQIVDTFTSDNWIGEALFAGEKAPLLLTKDAHFYLSRRSGQSKRHKIIIPKSDSITKLSHDHDNDVRRFLNYVFEITRPDRAFQCSKPLPSLANVSNPHYYTPPKKGIKTELQF